MKEYTMGKKYKSGDDSRCPTCGADLDGYDELEFMDGGVQLINYCPECDHTLVFNYFLDNVIDEDEEE